MDGESTPTKRPEGFETNHDAPDHYVGENGVDVWGVLRVKLTPEEYEGYLKGNIVKYVFRCGKKESATKDMEKAINYCRELKRVKGLEEDKDAPF